MNKNVLQNTRKNNTTGDWLLPNVIYKFKINLNEHTVNWTLFSASVAQNKSHRRWSCDPAPNNLTNENRLKTCTITKYNQTHKYVTFSHNKSHN